MHACREEGGVGRRLAWASAAVSGRPCSRTRGSGYLRGRRVAVDLSSWIVSAMSTKSPTRRNIFFRTLSLFSKMGAFRCMLRWLIDTIYRTGTWEL
ncbi:hypothetical protein ZWY2020_023976 [Hordeum vulgare]|nr:hypothetical protein ZWY2020_023976 [Hordeum vulgare]